MNSQRRTGKDGEDFLQIVACTQADSLLNSTTWSILGFVLFWRETNGGFAYVVNYDCPSACGALFTFGRSTIQTMMVLSKFCMKGL